jgi:hypothetical protein
MPRVSEGGGVSLARRFATGLSSLRDRAASRLAGSRFNPSRGRLAQIASIRLESIGDPRNLVVTAVYHDGQERVALRHRYSDEHGVYHWAAVFPPFERK